MSFDMNSVNVTGRLTRDPELSMVGSNQTALCKFSVAVGDGKDKTYFFDVQCWGKVAENCNQFVHKGNKIAISGKLEQSRWEKDGQNHSRIVINASMVYFLESKSSGQTGPEQPKQQAQQKPQAPADPFDDMPEVIFENGNIGSGDSECPF